MSWNRFLNISNTFLGRINIFSHCRWSLGIFFLATASLVYAGVPADENYDDNPGYAANNQNSFSLDGVKYTITGNTTYSTITSNNSGFSPLGGGSDYFLLFDSNGSFNVSSVKIEATDGSYFRLSGISIDALADASVTITPYNGATAGTPVSYTSNGLYITQQNINLSANTNFQYITSIVIAGGNIALAIDDLNFEPAVPPAPTVSDSRISISGASGTGGAYKIGDTVTATWNNTAGGDNNSGITGVTVDFSQFGGGSAVTATNSSGTWTATYTITAGSIDNTSRNVNVTATNSGGNTTTADTTNATVDNIAPTVTDPKINISGASGTGGAYKVGDTVTATWNNTGTGDNNSDTISSVTVNFSQFGGGSAVSATNSSGTWTATYTIAAGAVDNTNRNVTVTATDNAGNATATADTTNATVDNITPSVSSIAVSGSPLSTATSMAFTATFNETVSNISTDDFTLVGTGTATGTIASVSVSSGTSVDVNITGISGNGTLKVNLNASTNIADHVGNAIPTYTSGSTHTVAIPVAPGAPTSPSASAGDTQATITFTAPGSNGGSAITTYTATASPGGATGTCAGPTACAITVSSLTNGTAYTFTVTATNAIGTGSASTASNSVTPKGVQTITFASPGAQNFGTTPTLTATATSSLTPTFTSSTTGVCTITTGGALTFVTAGTCTINADQAGNGTYLAASQVSRSFTVNAIIPGAPTIGTATAGDTQATVTFTAPASTGGAAIIASGYTVTASPGGANAAGSNSPITVTGLTNGVAYTFTVTATTSAGTGAASAASNSVTPAANQTITFTNPGAQNFGTTPTLSATSDSGLTPTFTSSTTGVCTITTGGALSFVTTGTCTINANQAGNTSYLAAGQVSRSFTVNAIIPGAPTAAVATAGDTQASIAFTAPAFTGGATITGYTVTSNPGGVIGTGANSPIVVIGLTNGIAYTFTVTATNSAGTGSASAASNSITPAAAQTITFVNPGAQNFGTTPTLTATADSGLTPTFTSSTTGVCTITSGGALTFVTAGTCTINANQAGDSNYLPAGQVSRSFTINAVVPGAPTIGVATAGDAQVSVAFSAPANAGGTSITGYTVTSNPGGLTATGTNSPITVAGLTNGTAYTFTVTATNSVGTGSVSAASNSATPMATQTISFANPGAKFLNDSLTVTASASSGLAPSFSSFTTNVCTVTNGGVVTLLTTGTCTITANQSGNGNYASAIPVTHSFTVNPIPNRAPTISGSPATSISEGIGYSFTAIGSDQDADPLTYSITNKPSWATFNTATGSLTGTPTNANVGVTNGIVISVSDGILSASLPAFNLTVINVNDAPVISGSPAVKVEQDKAYQFTPTASDADKDKLTFSITNKPTWANFDSTTGALTGTPGNGDVSVTNGIVISVSDGTLSASLPAFNLAVVDVNDAPVISGSPALEVKQDIAYQFTPTASDADKDKLTFSIANKPGWASFDTATGALTGTPTNTDVGVTNGIVISVSDGTVSASLPAFNLTVTNVNDAPVISGLPAVTVNQDIAYQFVPTASDADKDKLTFSIANKPSWASFDTLTGALTGTPTRKDVGVTSGIVISVSDGTLSATLPAFAVEVVSTVDPLAPVLNLPANLHINATALYTPVSLSRLIGLSTSASQADLDAALAKIASDKTSGNACCKALPAGLNDKNNLLLVPGHHEIKWTATNAAGLSVEGTQIVDIDPIVSLSKSQVAVRGNTVDFRVILNGTAPVYPLTVPYVIDSATSATAAEHNLSNGSVTFTQEGQLEVAVPVQLAAVTGLPDSQLVINLGSGVNAGATNRHVISIHQGNVPPVVSMDIRQGGIITSLISPSAGPVTVSVNVQDANVGDTHTFDWSATSGLADTDGNLTNASRIFDPTGLTGTQQLQVTVTDSAGAAVQAQAYFKVVAALPILSETADTDKDGISDALEGTGDADGNGIPDYLDNMPSPNILPQTGSVTNAYLIECDPGVRCGLGLFARGSTSGGVQILNTELGKLDNLIIDPVFEPVGGIFDFAIKDLPVPGQTVRVVIPQQAPIPANAVYRKFHKGQWVDFISNTNNAIHSTAGNAGYCPPPGSAEWTPGLTQGHLCVQLSIEDGGPNDDDGLVNSAVVDPGAVSVALPVVPPVEPPTVEIKAKRGGAISEGWLLLLGGLMLVRRIKPKWFALIALLLASASSNADISTYLRADAFQARGDQTESKFANALGNHTFTLNAYDSSRTGFQIAFGYEWNKFTYTELGYLDLGDTKVDLTLSGKEDLTAFGTDFSKHYPRTGAGITLVQGVSLALSPAWTLSAEAGLFAWQDTAKLNITGMEFKSENAVDFLFGARLDYQLNNAWRLGLNLRRVTVENQHIDLLGVSTAWKF